MSILREMTGCAGGVVFGVMLGTICGMVEADERLGEVTGDDGSANSADGANLWNLDAINVTDVGSGRAVDYDGEGVYIAVIDAGLPYNWRAYFPEERIDTLHARAFSGGSEYGNVAEQAEIWEDDAVGHGDQCASIILGFNYSVGEDIPPVFNGVAPKATIIPVKAAQDSGSGSWSQLERALIYVTDLKVNGELGDAPLVVNISLRASAAV